MKECKGQFLVLNGSILPVESFNQDYLASGITIYEVFRLIDGKPLFLNEHLERLKRSLSIKSLLFPIDKNRMANYVNRLARANNILIGNIKLIIHFQNNSLYPDFLMYFVHHVYPDPADYENGVKTILYKAERMNPNVKIVNLNLRLTIENILKTKNRYEALLVNSKNEITEGNKSNLFFIKEDCIYTPPSEYILPGITRKYVFDICKSQKIKIEEKVILEKEVPIFDSAFLTGTSPKILPLALIDDFSFKVNNAILDHLITEYNRLINEDIHKK